MLKVNERNYKQVDNLRKRVEAGDSAAKTAAIDRAYKNYLKHQVRLVVAW
jgi:hypothetical protein